MHGKSEEKGGETGFQDHFFLPSRQLWAFWEHKKMGINRHERPHHRRAQDDAVEISLGGRQSLGILGKVLAFWASGLCSK